MEHRFISKLFKCTNCNKRFKKLVQFGDERISCEECGQPAEHLEENEFNREEADRTYRLAFDHSNEAFERQFHPTTDVFDRNPTNVFGDSQRRVRQTERQLRQQREREQARPRQPERTRTPSNASEAVPRNSNLQVIQYFPANLLMTYSISPFRGSVRRHPFQDYFGNFFSGFFQIPSSDFFMDNFASNFSSNFEDPMTRIIFMQSMQNQPSGNPPASKESLKKLKKFKMNEEFCKKTEKGEFEYPCCSVCLAEISKDQDTTLIPCGHMFHDSCILKWLDMHNSCPVCRYELPSDNADYERQIISSQRNTTNNNTRNSVRF